MGGNAPVEPRLEANCVTKKSATAERPPAATSGDVPPSRDRRRQTMAPMRPMATNMTGTAVRPYQRISNREASRPA